MSNTVNLSVNMQECSNCHGSGKVKIGVRIDPFNCDVCYGFGKLPDSKPVVLENREGSSIHYGQWFVVCSFGHSQHSLREGPKWIRNEFETEAVMHFLSKEEAVKYLENFRVA